jgi:hypothetical protein
VRHTREPSPGGRLLERLCVQRPDRGYHGVPPG